MEGLAQHVGHCFGEFVSTEQSVEGLAQLCGALFW